MSLAETIFQKFFGPDYEIKSQNGYDKVTGKGCTVLHGHGVLLAKRQGENYGERYLLNLKGNETDVLHDWIRAENYIDNHLNP